MSLQRKLAFIATASLCTCITAMGQNDYPKYEFGINFGFLVYQGDLSVERFGSIRTQKFTIGLHAGKILSSSFSVKANLAIGKLKGDDAIYDNPDYRKMRNFNFTTPVTELSAQLIWNVTSRNYADKGFSPYLFAGAGIAFLSIKKDYSKIDPTSPYFDPESSDIYARLAVDSAHTLPNVIPVLPVGAGFKYFITPQLGFNAETSYRFATTDYLDGFSEAANPKRKDNYLGYSVGVIYRTGNKNRMGCPVIKY